MGGVAGCKFSIGLYEYKTNTLIGVAICGRPISKSLDNGTTLEINRVCVLEGRYNGCSMLYGRCCRIAKAMGYAKVITYTTESENGSSLKASNFKPICKAGGLHWTGVRNTGIKTPNEYKIRWEMEL